MVSEIIGEVVRERTEATFGVMGNGNAFFVGDLVRHDHTYVKTRHEGGAMAAAIGYYLSTGKVAAATTTYGPGYTNALTGLAEGAMGKNPFVFVVGDAPEQARKFDIDQAAVAELLGAQTLRVNRSNARRLTHLAFDLAERDLKPVVVAIPYDIAEMPALEQEPREALEALPLVQPFDADVQKVAELLKSAERPLIIYGRGSVLAEARDELLAVSDRVNGLVASSVMARNYSRSQWDLGIAGGWGTVGATAVIGEADVVLVLGASMSVFQMRYNTLLSGAKHIVQVNFEDAATSPLVTEHVKSDIKLFAAALDAALEGHQHATDWRAANPGVPTREVHRPDELSETDELGRINPRALAIRLNELLPAERTIVQDGGHFQGWMAMYAEVPDHLGLQHPGLNFLSIGFGFPAALGAAVGRQDRLTVLTCGDGGSMMTLPDFESLIRQAPKALVVVFNDAAYGMEIHQYEHRGIKRDPMSFEDVNFAELAKVFGARSQRVTQLSELDAIKDFVDSDEQGVLVVDVLISPTLIAEYVSEKVEYDDVQAEARLQYLMNTN